MKQKILIAKLLYQLYKIGQRKEIDDLVKKLRKEEKTSLLKNSLPLLKRLYYKEYAILKGELETAFEFDNLSMLETFLGRRIEVDKRRINPDLILGGVFRSEELEIDFSFKNLFKRWKI